MQELSHEEMLRYNRQIILRGFDFDGQEKLKASKVLVIGLGGLGCAATQYLAAAGVGYLTLVDFDTVSLSNLQRQTLHRDATIGEPKVDSAKSQLSTINPHIHIDAINAQLNDDQLSQLIANHHVVLDCTDNIAIREQLNRLCLLHKKPFVSGAAIRMEGQLSVFTYENNTPCYHCLSRLFGDNNLTCIEAGVMAPLVGTIGTLEAMETIKLLAHYGKVNTGKVLLFDAMTMDFRQFSLNKDPHCEVCAKAPDQL